VGSLTRQVQGLMVSVKNVRRGKNNLVIDLDTLIDLVIEEYNADVGRSQGYLEALFLAADSNGDGVLTYDEFSELVRRADSRAPNSQISAMFVEAIRLSGAGDAIVPSAFASVALSYQLMRGKASSAASTGAQAAVKPQESLALLKELVASMHQKMASLDPTSAARFTPMLTELDELMLPPHDAQRLDRAWSLYRSITAQIGRLLPR